MNYIQALRSENANLKAEVEAMREAARDFIAHLQSPKFQGTGIDGERKDWIATADAARYAENILTAGNA
jgi:hypothetical protein